MGKSLHRLNYGNINFFADRGNQQYIWLRELHEKYKISNSSLVTLFIMRGDVRKLRLGETKFFSNLEEEEYCLALLEGYLSLEPVLDIKVWVDQDFIRALRIMFQSINSEELGTAIEKYGKIITVQDHDKDYLRVFEEVVNKGKQKANHARFF